MGDNTGEVVGHGTLSDGTHVPLTRSHADALMASVEKSKKARSEKMPTTADALRALQDAYERLRELGWKPGSYCPKDGTEFAAIEYGSTGIFTGFFSGKWPYDFAHIEDGGIHPHGYLWKPIDALTDAEAEARERSRQGTSEFIDRIGRMAGPY